MSEKIVVYEGPDRRTPQTPAGCDCHYHQKIAAIEAAVDQLTESVGVGEQRMDACKTAVDNDITVMNQAIAALHTDMSNMRAEMQTISGNVGAIKDHMGTIAEAVQQLADFGPTWTKIKGFWAALQFLKDNWGILAVLAAMLWVASGVPLFGVIK